jgi:hypothetical protein
MRLPSPSIPFVVASAALGLLIGCSGAPDGGLDATGDSGATGSDDASGGTGGDANVASDANVGSDATSHGDAGPTACTTDSDCVSGDLCEFKIADACSAVGVCITPPPPGPMCAAYSAACTCDDRNINVVCTRYQSGYASSPVAHRGACAGGDAKDAGGGGGGSSFACGTSSCNNSQVCKTTEGGAYPSKTTTACVDYPTQCGSTHTCACVKQALSASTCTESKGNVTVTFLYP